MSIKTLKTLVKLNLTGIYCPNCAVSKGEYPTAGFTFMKDELYHKTKYYIRCKVCDAVTPAYEDPKDAIENWDDLFIKKELETVLKEDKDEYKATFSKSKSSIGHRYRR